MKNLFSHFLYMSKDTYLNCCRGIFWMLWILKNSCTRLGLTWSDSIDLNIKPKKNLKFISSHLLVLIIALFISVHKSFFHLLVLSHRNFCHPPYIPYGRLVPFLAHQFSRLVSPREWISFCKRECSFELSPLVESCVYPRPSQSWACGELGLFGLCHQITLAPCLELGILQPMFATH